MITFYGGLPVSVVFGGRRYRLDATHTNVLRMYDAVQGMDDAAQVEIMLHYLVKGRCRPSVELLEAVSKVLFGTQKDGGGKAFDFKQDSELIYAAFVQAYGIDLCDTPLHWWKFRALLSGLPSDTRFSEVVRIRTMDIPAPTKYNAEQRQQIIRLKSEYALRMSAEERERNLQDGLRKMLSVLLSRVEDG